MTSWFGKRVRAIAWSASCVLLISTFLIEQPAFAQEEGGDGVLKFVEDS